MHSPYGLVHFCWSLNYLLVLIYSKLHSKCDWFCWQYFTLSIAFSIHLARKMYFLPCLVPRPHYYARPMRFGSRGQRKFLRPSPGSRPFVSDTSPKCIDREDLERRRTGTRQLFTLFGFLEYFLTVLLLFCIQNQIVNCWKPRPFS